MSNVYKRFRGKTGIEVIINALDLQADLTTYVHKEKFVPKKYRFMLGSILINKVDEMVDNITFANSIFPSSEEKLDKRKEYQTKAIINCFQLQNQIVRLEKCVATVTIDNLDNIIDKLCQELVLLRGWQQTDKVISKKLKS